MHYFLSSVATYLKGSRISNISAPCSLAPATVSGSIGMKKATYRIGRYVRSLSRSLDLHTIDEQIQDIIKITNNSH